jgi:adenylate cyclase
MQSLAEATAPPGVRPESVPRFAALAEGDSARGKTLVRWLRAVMGVLESAASSADFFDKAAQTVVDIVGLDSGRVLLLEGEQWQCKAHHAVAGAELCAEPPSQYVLSTVGSEKRTFWQLPAFGASRSGGASLAGVTAVVAAPILNSCGNVIGAIYGDRRQSGPSRGSPSISEVEAMLVELLACGVAAGLARLEQERATLSARVQFEQFFTPELSRQLAAEPDLLRGRDAEITVLFCDIRGFSQISERLGPAKTVAWLSDVMNALSTCVRGHSGVLVDYIGDELVAMWGAPEQQPDHARLACSAALAILGTLPELIARWQPVIGVPMGLGIGINSGIARVGNTGSRYKFKYGPLGNAVNLASRVEGSTKYLRTRLLITGGTRAQLDANFTTRRLCRVRVVNIAEPVDLYELAPPDDPRWTDRKDRYEQALMAFERRDFRDAVQIVGNLLHEYPDDGPALILLSRSTSSLIEDSPCFVPVWELPGK